MYEQNRAEIENKMGIAKLARDFLISLVAAAKGPSVRMEKTIILQKGMILDDMPRSFLSSSMPENKNKMQEKISEILNAANKWTEQREILYLSVVIFKAMTENIRMAGMKKCHNGIDFKRSPASAISVAKNAETYPFVIGPKLNPTGK
jgi:hypothetical protein